MVYRFHDKKTIFQMATCKLELGFGLIMHIEILLKDTGDVHFSDLH